MAKSIIIKTFSAVVAQWFPHHLNLEVQYQAATTGTGREKMQKNHQFYDRLHNFDLKGFYILSESEIVANLQIFLIACH